jgi:preprotein translocase subunit YajC
MQTKTSQDPLRVSLHTGKVGTIIEAKGDFVTVKTDDGKTFRLDRRFVRPV